MPAGYHHFYVTSWTNPNRFKIEYFIGGFVGDHWNDEVFAAKLDRITRRVTAKYGFSNFIQCWSPVNVNPYKPRTPDERYKTAVTKTTNKYAQRITQIKNDNTLFVEAFIKEEKVRLFSRLQVLKKRYGQPDK